MKKKTRGERPAKALHKLAKTLALAEYNRKRHDHHIEPLPPVKQVPIRWWRTFMNLWMSKANLLEDSMTFLLVDTNQLPSPEDINDGLRRKKNPRIVEFSRDGDSFWAICEDGYQQWVEMAFDVFEENRGWTE